MKLFSRVAIFGAIAIAICLSATAAAAAPGSPSHGTSGCANLSVSAFSQYCEDLPAATGPEPEGAEPGGTATGGTATVGTAAPAPAATALPVQIRTKLLKPGHGVSRRVAQHLLALASDPPARRARRPLLAAATTSAMLPGPLTAVLIAVALVMGALAYAGRRRST